MAARDLRGRKLRAGQFHRDQQGAHLGAPGIVVVAENKARPGFGLGGLEDAQRHGSALLRQCGEHLVQLAGQIEVRPADEVVRKGDFRDDAAAHFDGGNSGVHAANDIR